MDARKVATVQDDFVSPLTQWALDVADACAAMDAWCEIRKEDCKKAFAIRIDGSTPNVPDDNQ